MEEKETKDKLIEDDMLIMFTGMRKEIKEKTFSLHEGCKKYIKNLEKMLNHCVLNEFNRRIIEVNLTEFRKFNSGLHELWVDTLDVLYKK